MTPTLRAKKEPFEKIERPKSREETPKEGSDIFEEKLSHRNNMTLRRTIFKVGKLPNCRIVYNDAFEQQTCAFWP